MSLGYLLVIFVIKQRTEYTEARYPCHTLPCWGSDIEEIMLYLSVPLSRFNVRDVPEKIERDFVRDQLDDADLLSSRTSTIVSTFQCDKMSPSGKTLVFRLALELL